jgi:MFS transporter, putative metabolite:H+ symporter
MDRTVSTHAVVDIAGAGNPALAHAQSAALISARIDRLPPCGPIWSWLAVISFGAFFEIYETSLTSLLAPLLVKAGVFRTDSGGLLGLPDLATFGFATFFGLFVGAILFASVADRVGRRAVFTYSLVWYALATLLMAVQAEALAVCVWRFVAAVGVGAGIISVDAYISEMMPKAIRGRGFAISKAIQYSAVPIAGILAAILSRKTAVGSDGWRVMLLVPCVGAALIWWVRRGLPESPRWLAAHGRGAEAEAILTDVETRVVRAIGVPLAPAEPVVAVATESRAGHLALFQGQMLRRTVLLVVSSCAITVAYFGFGNWLPSLLQARGVDVTKSLAYSALIAFSYPLAPVGFSWFADRIERKWQIVIGAAITVVAGLLFTLQTAAAGWIACGLVITIANNLASYATHTYRSELFPTAVRARGIGLVYSIDRLVAAFNSYLIGFILVRVGVSGVLVFIAAAMVVAIIVVGLYGPRTRGLGTDAIRNRGG